MYLVTLHHWLFYILTLRVSFFLQKYIHSKYQLTVCLITNTLYRYQPWKKRERNTVVDAFWVTAYNPSSTDNDGLFFPPLKAKKKKVFTDRVSRLRSYPPHPGLEEHWSPPAQRSSSLFHQNSLTHHHLVLYARREVFRCQNKKRKSSSCFCKICHLWCDLNPATALFPLTYLLFIDFKCLFDIGDLWRTNWQSLDFTGSESTEVSDRFDVSGSNKLPKTTRPLKRINSRCGWSFRFYIDLKGRNIWPNTKHFPSLTTCWKISEAAQLLQVQSSRPGQGRYSLERQVVALGSFQKSRENGCNYR